MAEEANAAGLGVTNEPGDAAEKPCTWLIGPAAVKAGAAEGGVLAVASGA